MWRKFSFLSILAGLVLVGAGCIQFGGGGANTVGMYRSENKGDAWSAAMAYPTANGVASISGANVFRLVQDPSDPNAVYLATRGQGMFYTYNYGQTWQSADVLAGKFIYAVVVDPNNKCIIYTTDGAHIYKTVDCSRTWRLVYTEERPNERFVALTVDNSNSDMIYGALLGGQVIVSANGGSSWRVAHDFKVQLQHITSDPFQPKRLYVATYRNGLYRSEDYGATWTDLTGGLENYNDSKTFYRLVLNHGKRDSLFWVSKYGILRSDDAGVNWKELKLLNPPGSVNIYAFAINPDNQNEMYYTSTVLGEKNVNVRSTFYRTIDGGKNWVTKKMPTNTIPTNLLINPRNASQLLLGFSTL